MSPQTPLGQLIQSFFLDHLIAVKGLRPASVRSYRDTIRLLIVHVAMEKRSRITKLTVGDLTFERTVGFLRHLEDDRGNHIRTRNQRLAAIHTLFEYIATRSPEMLMTSNRSRRSRPNASHRPRRGSWNATRSNNSSGACRTAAATHSATRR